MFKNGILHTRTLSLSQGILYSARVSI